MSDIEIVIARPGRPAKEIPPIHILREKLCYDPDSGVFTYLYRSDIPACLNVRRFGKRAGYIHRTGYRYISIDGSSYAEHRLAWVMSGNDANDEIDHINGVKEDNRLCNLRLADRIKNAQNRSKNKNNTSGYPGVTVDGSMYTSRIGYGRKRYHIGTFATAEEAYSEYLRAKKMMHKFNPTQRL